MGTHSEPGGTRTLGHRIKSPMLYRLSYWLDLHPYLSRMGKNIKGKKDDFSRMSEGVS